MASFKEKLAEPGRVLSGHVVTIPSPVVAQAGAAAGADLLIFDMEHGALDWASLHAMTAATQGFDCAPGVRLPEIDAALAKRALDLGVEVVCFPLLRSAEDARACVAALRYPVAGGVRGVGPFVAHSRWGVGFADYAREVGPRAAALLLIETRDAVEEIEAICAVEGVDALVLAGFDLSMDLGIPGRFDHPDFAAAVARVEAAAAAAGVPLGGVAFTAEQAAALKARGYRMIAGFDVLSLKESFARYAAWAREL
jgi:4-hydroxy-2-oxoheptanedioate aldolase